MITKYFGIKTGVFAANLDRGNGGFYMFWKADGYSGQTFQDDFNNIFDPDRDHVLEFRDRRRPIAKAGHLLFLVVVLFGSSCRRVKRSYFRSAGTPKEQKMSKKRGVKSLV
ncbi:MAG: hypothetical protein LBD31_05010 [Treponema sp.]|nr:hypothetical protein [Treponema sp.]